MTQENVMELFHAALMLALKLSAPMLIIAMLVGLVIAIFQAATSVHEQTITFAPKAVSIALALLITGPWMINSVIDFMNYIFDLIEKTGIS